MLGIGTQADPPGPGGLQPGLCTAALPAALLGAPFLGGGLEQSIRSLQMRVVFLFLRRHGCSDVAAALGVGVSTPGAAGQAGKAPRGLPSSPPEHFPFQGFRGLVSWWSASSSQTWKRGWCPGGPAPTPLPPLFSRSEVLRVQERLRHLRSLLGRGAGDSGIDPVMLVRLH